MALDFSSLDKFSEMLNVPAADAAGMRKIPLSQIDPDPNQPRQNFDEAALHELAQSIKIHGVIEPVVLRSAGERFQLIAGERRWRAAGIAQLDAIPAIIRDDLTARAQMVENIQRQDLSPFEIYREITTELDAGASQKELAAEYGKSKQWISDYANVAKMPPALQDALREGRATDISALNALARLHKQAPDQVLRLAESGSPITRHLVAQLADSLARRAATGSDVSGDGSDTAPKGSPKPGSASKTVEAAPKTASAGVADDGQGMDIGGRAPAAVPGGDDDRQSSGNAYTPPAQPKQDLPVNIKVGYEGEVYWLRYDRQRSDDGGRNVVMLASDAGLTLYAPLSDLVIEAIYPQG